MLNVVCFEVRVFGPVCMAEVGACLFGVCGG